jgi:hypothetical protein
VNRNRAIVVLGLLIAGWAAARAFHLIGQATPAQAAAPTAVPSVESDLQQLKDKAPDQAHAMTSVAYHFNNLWFAGEAQNWPLAQFYWNETRSHLRWAVRVIPVRKDNAGVEIKLADILQAMENTPLEQLQKSIERKNYTDFVAAYKFSLETCYACHKAADKPYLRPQIPEHPAEPTINFDPQATWPK